MAMGLTDSAPQRHWSELTMDALHGEAVPNSGRRNIATAWPWGVRVLDRPPTALPARGCGKARGLQREVRARADLAEFGLDEVLLGFAVRVFWCP